PNADTAGVQASCFGTAACAVAGVYGDTHGNQQVFVADWGSGHWSTQTLPGLAKLNTGGLASVFALACGKDGGCAVGGQVFLDPPTQKNVRIQAFASSHLRGNWSMAQEIGAIDTLPDTSTDAAACPPKGRCLIGGTFTSTSKRAQGFVAADDATA